ncbi:MAG: T9SS type A sorting domain-containing protein [Candidatus Cloacimonetes bacterium]|nr:T9SS type A sorting domain-containing protein [Candidatus Cloacimonadota bacterium]MDY0172148.1 T9SS type A sorting domain-containing protein [Candidatus Cloacimonadaceae bacterium]
MKKLFLLGLCLMIGLAFSLETLPEDVSKPAQRPQSVQGAQQSREAPVFSFSKAPYSLMTSYDDYMIGSYNSLPLRTIPDVAGGGYSLTFHAKSSPSAFRNVFYAHMDLAGNMTHCQEITGASLNEGYPAMDIDPVSGIPLYAWHTGTGAGANLWVMFTSDPLIDGIPGSLNAGQIVINNPVELGGTLDNTFIWPQLHIGPSPFPNMRRVYIAASNRVSHVTELCPSENMMIAYADFDTDMLRTGALLSWSYTTIPQLDQWNNATEVWRRPKHSFNVDNSGNIYVTGYHYASGIEYGDVIVEEDLDIFICPNYGEGSWSWVRAYSNLPSWNPPEPDVFPTGYFKRGGQPIPDEELYWKIWFPTHLNTVVDQEGRVHTIGLWAFMTHADLFHPYMDDCQTVKSFVFDPQDQSVSFKEIYPQNNTDNIFSPYYQPWDVEPPWGEPDSFTWIDGDLHLDYEKNFPFPHWDVTLYNDEMRYQYNNQKLSAVNDQDMMVAVWQDSQRALEAHNPAAFYPDTFTFANTSEIMICVSQDAGDSWSQPIRLNNIETLELAGIKPMWAYPADLVKYLGTRNGKKIGRLGLLFFDDYTWGSYSAYPSDFNVQDGGRVMFTELEIEFPDPSIGTDDPSYEVPAVCSINAAYPNPFKEQLNISLELKDASQDYRFKIYNVRGQLVHSATGNTKGSFDLNWDGRDAKGTKLPSGIYLLSLSTQGQQATRKVILY